MDLPNSISSFITIGDYTVIDHVISLVACFSILIVSKMSASTSSDYPAELLIVHLLAICQMITSFNQ